MRVYPVPVSSGGRGRGQAPPSLGTGCGRRWRGALRGQLLLLLVLPLHLESC